LLVEGQQQRALPPFINSPAKKAGVANLNGSFSKNATHPLCPEETDDVFKRFGSFLILKLPFAPVPIPTTADGFSPADRNKRAARNKADAVSPLQACSL
jgi:hypothetical protein